MALPKMTTDPYAVLGIPNDAASAAIRSSYKKLILQCHPDKVHDESLREEKAIQFQKVQEAYELLIDSRRRRKYDEELVKQAKAAAEAATAKPPPPPAAAQPQQQPMQTPHMAHAHPHTSHRSASGPGPSPGSAERSSERADRPRRERSGTNPSSDDRQKEKEREARHARKREGRDRKSREESSWTPEEQSSRKEAAEKYAAWLKQEEAARNLEAAERARREYEDAQRYAQPQAQQTHTRHPDEPPKKGYNRYTADGSPRKASYDARQYEVPNAKVPPAAPVPPMAPDVRPGYLEAKEAERERLLKVKAKMGIVEEPSRPPVSEERDGLRERDRMRQETERRERTERGSRDRERDRGSEVPQYRRSSKTPPLRRGSSVTSRCDEVPSTPMMRPAATYGASAPTHTSYPPTSGAANYAPRRRHSSPSIEKQASRMHPREVPAPCDSGYSSPSTDTPIVDKKVPTPEMRTATDGIDNSSGAWKKYTFEVYVHEGIEADAQAKGGIPSRYAHRQPASTSPSIHPADPANGPAPPLPAEHVQKAANIYGLPSQYAVPVSMYPQNIDPRYPPAPSSSIHPHSPPSSHHSHSPHSPHASPPRQRHHHSPVLSPRLVSEFVQPGLTRSNTTPYHSHSSRSRERDHGYGYAPSLGRNSTFSN